MNSARQLIPPRIFAGTLLALSCAFASPSDAHSQTQQTPPPEQASAQAAPAAGSAAAETDATQKRLSRARSLAAIGKLAAAAADLESLRTTSNDESVRDVSRVLLMAILVEMPDYPRAAALLDEAFRARSPGPAGNAATHSYFAIAGQMVNAVRTHLERYRAFGVNVADASELPPEAAGDVEQLRELLDRVVGQAKALHAEQLKGAGEGSKGLDAAALLEDAATVRTRIARHDQDRARWQAEVSEARQHLFSSEMRVASISQPPAARPSPAPVAAAPAPKTSATDRSSQQPRGEQRSAAPANTQTAGTVAPAAQSPAAGGVAADAGATPVSVGSLLGKAKQRVTPAYPQIARAARVTGNVTVYLVVNEKGEVESVQRALGPVQLQPAAIEAARRFKFNPTEVDGRPARVSGYLSFNFAP
ncbi:MAG: TonB family protein [Acidobacteria bacterium]|nr:TonB family protein [Acidobacteriota bacterium]